MGVIRRLASTQPRLLLAPMVVVGILSLTSQAGSAATRAHTTRIATGSVNCTFLGIVRFSPPLKDSGGGSGPSSVSGKLSGCTNTSTGFSPSSRTPLRGEFSSSPFSCSSSSQTGAALSTVISWRGTGGIAATQVTTGTATGSFPGPAVLSLGLPPALSTGCARKRGLSSARVSGTLSITDPPPPPAPLAFQTSPGAANCSFTGTVTFAPALTATGSGTGSSTISATLSSCTSNSGIVEGFGSPQLEGTFASSPFDCSSSSPTNAALSAMITWSASTAWPSGEIASTTIDGSNASGSFAGGTVVNLQVPSDVALGCAGGPVSTDNVSGTITMGPECGVVGNPLSVDPIVPPICGAESYLPTSITTGSDGALWFTTYNSNLIGRTTTSGVTTMYPAPTGGQVTWGNGGITSGSDGALWFLENDGQEVGRITTSGSVSAFPLPPGSGWAEAITSGPDGALWFITDNVSGSNAIGRLTTSGQFTMFTDAKLGTADWNAASGHRFLWDITSGSDGALWFSENFASNKGSGAWIGRCTTSGAVTTYNVPGGVVPTTLTAGPDGAIWFGTNATVLGPSQSGVIGRVTTSGMFSEYTDPGNIGQVLGITAGPDGALWFTNYSVPGDYGFYPFPPIGRITTSGTITTYGSAYDEQGAMGITVGSDGAIWFNDHLNDSLGRISVP